MPKPPERRPGEEALNPHWLAFFEIVRQAQRELEEGRAAEGGKR